MQSAPCRHCPIRQRSDPCFPRSPGLLSRGRSATCSPLQRHDQVHHALHVIAGLDGWAGTAGQTLHRREPCPNGTKMYAAKILEPGFRLLVQLVHKSIEPTFVIRHQRNSSWRRAGSAAAHFTRDFVGVPTGTEDRIPGGFDSTRESARIETDAFARGGLILGDTGEREGAHNDPDSPGGPGTRGIIDRIARFADCHHQHEPDRPPLQPMVEFLAQIIIVRQGIRIGVANACDRLPGKTNGATNAIFTFHYESVDGVIGRTDIAHRGADHLGLEHR